MYCRDKVPSTALMACLVYLLSKRENFLSLSLNYNYLFFTVSLSLCVCVCVACVLIVLRFTAALERKRNITFTTAGFKVC